MNSKGKGLGLFSKLSRKSMSDLSEWNKNDEKLMQHIEKSELREIISLLKKKKVCSTKLDPQGHSALHVAAMRNKYDVVQLLIAYSANVTAVDFQGRTALHCAARHGASEVLEVLSHSKEDDWPRDENNMTALHQACIGGSLDCVINLIRKYPKDIQSGDEDGRTPLFYAAQIGHLNVCKELLDRGANVNTRDKFGRTALMCAAENGNRLICELFVKKGVDVSICDQMGRTASWHAMDAGHTTVKQTIEPSLQADTLIDNQDKDIEYDRHRLHSPIPEESESVFGEDDTLPLRYRSGNSLRISGEEAGDPELELGLSGADSDEDFKTSTLSDTDDDGSISPRLSELSYTMSYVKDDSQITNDVNSLPANGNLSKCVEAGARNTPRNTPRNIPRMYIASDDSDELPESILRLEMERELGNQNKTIMVTDLDAEEEEGEGGATPKQMTPSMETKNKEIFTPDLSGSGSEVTSNLISSKPSKSQSTTLDDDAENASTPVNSPQKSIVPPNKTLTSQEKIVTLQQKSMTSQQQSVITQDNKTDILMSSESVYLSTTDVESETNSSLSSDDDETEVPTVSSLSETSKSDQTVNTDLKKAHDSLLTNYESLKSDYEEMRSRLTDVEKDQRRRSQEDLEVTEQLEMVVQLGELSTQLDDEQSKNKMLQAQIITLENLAAGATGKIQQPAFKEMTPERSMNWIDDFGGEYEDDSDDEFGFPGLCMLNNSSGKQTKEEVKPIAKVSGRPRQMSLKEENREIAKLKIEIESIDRQKHSLTEALTQLQSKYEESEHSRKKLFSDLDVSKSTLEVKNQENQELMNENEELRRNVSKYKERSVAAVEQTKSYKKEADRLGCKLELYDKEYRKVKERLKRKDANEKRMLKDRQSCMKKMDEAIRRMKESEKSLESLRQSTNEEVDRLMVKCEDLDSEMLILRDFNEDQNDEIERLNELASCSEEMSDLKQLEIQSLEKQISLLKDISATPQRRDSIRDTQKTVQSLQEQITKLQAQLAETAASYQETIDIYRNNLIMASKNLLDPDVKEAILHVIELRKPSI